jgi:hypothetical protein
MLLSSWQIMFKKLEHIIVGTVILILSVTLLFKVTILCNFSSACHLQHYHFDTNKTLQISSLLPYQFLSSMSKSDTNLMYTLVRKFDIHTVIKLSSCVEAGDLLPCL